MPSNAVLIMKRTDIPAGVLNATRRIWPRRSSYVKSYENPIEFGVLTTKGTTSAPTVVSGVIVENCEGLIPWILTNVSAGRSATGTITVVEQASLLDGETFTIDDGTNPAVVFEYDVAGDGVGGGNVQVNVSGDTTVLQVLVRTRQAIQGQIDLGNLDITITDDDGVDTLTLTVDAYGVAGNNAITDTVVDAGFVVTGLAGGVDATALTRTQAITTATEILARVGVDANTTPLDLDPDSLNANLSHGTWDSTQVLGLMYVLAGREYLVPAGTVIESGGLFTNPGIEFSGPVGLIYQIGDTTMSVRAESGELYQLMQDTWTYRGTSRRAIVMYGLDGFIFT